jgi:hypothetical protein
MRGGESEDGAVDRTVNNSEAGDVLADLARELKAT